MCSATAETESASGGPALAVLNPSHGVVGQDHVEPGDRDAVDEEASNRLFEIPPIERHLHGELGAEAKFERAPYSVNRDGGGGQPQRPGSRRIWFGDAEEAARHAHDQRPAQAQMDGDDDENPVGRERMDLPHGEAAIGRHDAGQRMGDQHAGDEQHHHGDEQRQGDGDIDQSPCFPPGPGDRAVEAPVEDVVDHEQQEHRSPGQFVGRVAEPPIREAEQQKAGSDEIERQPQQEHGIQGAVLSLHSTGVPLNLGMRYAV